MILRVNVRDREGNNIDFEIGDEYELLKKRYVIKEITMPEGDEGKVIITLINEESNSILEMVSLMKVEYVIRTKEKESKK